MGGEARRGEKGRGEAKPERPLSRIRIRPVRALQFVMLFDAPLESAACTKPSGNEFDTDRSILPNEMC